MHTKEFKLLSFLILMVCFSMHCITMLILLFVCFIFYTYIFLLYTIDYITPCIPITWLSLIYWFTNLSHYNVVINVFYIWSFERWIYYRFSMIMCDQLICVMKCNYIYRVFGLLSVVCLKILLHLQILLNFLWSMYIY